MRGGRSSGQPSLGAEVGVRGHVAVVVAGDRVRKPVAVRAARRSGRTAPRRAPSRCRPVLRSRSVSVSSRASPRAVDHLGAEPQLHVLGRPRAGRAGTGTCCRRATRRDERVTLLGVARRCIAAWPAELPPPSTNDVPAGSRGGLRTGRPVEDARARPAPRAPGCRAGGRRRRWRAPRSGRSPRRRRRSRARAGRAPCGARSTSRHQQEARAEDPGLLVGALGELGAADAAGEAEVVADQRAGAGLPADRLALDDERRRPSDEA